ncbi:hypothetical protein LR48_Vigan10g126700 [Vigna angularis]|uniref:Uncharacterized protein n=1 Tax=Phaseolus angularis TaxID=3914 RepID=A0A0L9VJZ3_PHAAN|nr:hypothetical protein LR48_Vigan10g126700 [Vigna angularis]
MREKFLPTTCRLFATTGSLEEVDVVRIINYLPRRLSARGLVECLGHEDIDRLTFHMKDQFFASKKKIIGDSSLKGRDPRSAFSSLAAQVVKNCPILIESLFLRKFQKASSSVLPGLVNRRSLRFVGQRSERSLRVGKAVIFRFIRRRKILSALFRFIGRRKV